MTTFIAPSSLNWNKGFNTFTYLHLGSDSDSRLRTEIYDNRYDFNFPVVILPFTRSSSSRESFLLNNRVSGINRENDRRGDIERAVGQKQANLPSVGYLSVRLLIRVWPRMSRQNLVIGISLLANTYLLTRSYVAVYSHGRHRNRNATGAHGVNWAG